MSIAAAGELELTEGYHPQITRVRRRTTARRRARINNVGNTTRQLKDHIRPATQYKRKRRPHQHKRVRRLLLRDPETGAVEEYDTLVCGSHIGDKRSKHEERAVAEAIKEGLLGFRRSWKRSLVPPVDVDSDRSLIRRLLDGSYPLGDFTGVIEVGGQVIEFVRGVRLAPRVEPPTYLNRYDTV